MPLCEAVLAVGHASHLERPRDRGLSDIQNPHDLRGCHSDPESCLWPNGAGARRWRCAVYPAGTGGLMCPGTVVEAGFRSSRGQEQHGHNIRKSS